jgi:hypothetical protein
MKALRISLGILLLVIAANAFGGGYYGMSGAENVPKEWLEGSPFESYFFPSFFLFAIIGGMCLLAAIAVLRNSKYSARLSYSCAILLLGWIGIQVTIIGYVSWMQPAIFIAAILILLITFIIQQKKNKPAII